MTKKIALLATATLAAGAPWVVSGQQSMAAQGRHRCNAHRVYRSTRRTLVYRHAAGHDDGVGNPVTVLYACARPDGAPVAIASDSSPGAGEYPPNDLLKELVVAGNYAGSLMVQGEGDQSVCEKYAQPSCPTPTTMIRAADVRSRRLVAITVVTGTHGLILSASTRRDGAAVWLEPSGTDSILMGGVLVPHGKALRASPSKLDTGRISHVRLVGRRVTWLNNGVWRHAVLLPG